MILFTTSFTKESKHVGQQPFIRLRCPASSRSMWGQIHGGTQRTSLFMCSRPQAAKMVCVECLTMTSELVPESIKPAVWTFPEAKLGKS